MFFFWRGVFILGHEFRLGTVRPVGRFLFPAPETTVYLRDCVRDCERCESCMFPSVAVALIRSVVMDTTNTYHLYLLYLPDHRSCSFPEEQTTKCGVVEYTICLLCSVVVAGGIRGSCVRSTKSANPDRRTYAHKFVHTTYQTLSSHVRTRCGRCDRARARRRARGTKKRTAPSRHPTNGDHRRDSRRFTIKKCGRQRPRTKVFCLALAATYY